MYRYSRAVARAVEIEKFPDEFPEQRPSTATVKFIELDVEVPAGRSQLTNAEVPAGHGQVHRVGC